MSDSEHQAGIRSVEVTNPGAASAIVLVCEHASNLIPDHLGGLGLDADAAQSHIAWDPGALSVARGLSERLDAVLVSGTVSRLVYDCNRPPDAPGAIAEISETFVVPGNRALAPDARQARVDTYYTPFRDALAARVAAVTNPVLVTIHSFTPVFHGAPRAVEIGILHDADTRLADAMLGLAADHTDRVVARNAPYGPEDGVTHTLREHGLPGGHPNVMIELRSDLVADAAAQARMAETLAAWIGAALGAMANGDLRCTG